MEASVHGSPGEHPDLAGRPFDAAVRRLRFGASYYHEYLPMRRLEEDLRLMLDAGLTFVRVGESTWSSFEPRDGEFRFGWLDEVVDAAHDAGLAVVVGTPTYAIPPWLALAHPEVMAQRATGQPVPYGGRQNMDLTHPVYRRYAERIIRAVVERYAPHPGVVGWQVDNETGVEILHNPGVLAGFRRWLETHHGDPEALNQRWGLTYWSQRITSFDELWPPDGNTSQGYDLDWRRYQSELVTEFLAWQVGLVREYARPDQFVMQDLVGGHGRPTADMRAIAGTVDLVGTNPYYPTQDALALPEPEDVSAGSPEWLAEGGAASVHLKADLAYGAGNRPFLVAETTATSIGESHVNFPHWPGQRRLIVHTLLARGAVGVAYWHWHTLHYGQETYWGGILGHDLRPGRTYAELAGVGGELGSWGDLLDGLTPDADVAVLYSADSRYALSFQPPLAVPGTRAPDRRAYERVVNAVHRGCFDARLPARFVHPDQVLAGEVDPATVPVLAVPALYVASDDLLDALAGYAAAGGHLVITFRTGYADEHARARWEPQPARLREAAGITYQEYTNLLHPVPVRAVQGLDDGLPALELPDGAGAAAAATGWADGLELEGATALAEYEHRHLGRTPAVTTHRHGRGRVTWIGTLPGPALCSAVLSWVAAVSLPPPLWTDLPVQVRVDGARRPDGARLWFLGNFGDEERSVRLPVAAAVPGRTRYRVGDRLTLPGWGCVVLVQDAGQPGQEFR